MYKETQVYIKIEILKESYVYIHANIPWQDRLCLNTPQYRTQLASPDRPPYNPRRPRGRAPVADPLDLLGANFWSPGPQSSTVM